MSTPAIRTNISMDGEKEYKKAISDINSGLKVLVSEMKLTAAQFEDNSSGMEALTAKSDVLERQILSQKEKVETLEAALQNSAEAYGEADRRTDAWKVSLNNAEAELIRMERELKDTRAALEDAADAVSATDNSFEHMSDAVDNSADAAQDGDTVFKKFVSSLQDTDNKATKLGDVIGGLAGKLGLDLPSGATSALNSLGSLKGSTVALAGAAAATAVSIFEIEKALIALTATQATSATAISRLSATVNMNVESAQKWDYVLKTVGSSLEQSQGDLSAFQEKIYEAAQGTGEAAEMFKQLGVSVVGRNNEIRGLEPVLAETIVALQNMANETERNAISSALLGSTGEALIPLYNQSTEAILALAEQKSNIGILTEQEIEALSAVSLSMVEYNERINAANDSLAKDFAPALAAFYSQAGAGLQSLAQSAEQSGLVNIFASLLEIVTALTPALDAMGSVLQALSPILHTVAIALGVVADTLRAIMNIIGGVGNLLTLDPGAAMGNFNNALNAFGPDSATARAWTNSWNASGDYNFDGGFTWVGENGPELAWFPKGTRIASAQESRTMRSGDVYYVTIDAHNVKDFNDVVSLAKKQRRASRMEGNMNGNH